jgi:regulator of sirC expression with transglutaminase-like and TPR domain
MSLQFSFPRQQLCQIAQADSLRLAEAALWIAQEEYPTLDPAIALDQLDQMKGVNFPGHFLIRPRVADCEFLVKILN